MSYFVGDLPSTCLQWRGDVMKICETHCRSWEWESSGSWFWELKETEISSEKARNVSDWMSGALVWVLKEDKRSSMNVHNEGKSGDSHCLFRPSNPVGCCKWLSVGNSWSVKPPCVISYHKCRIVNRFRRNWCPTDRTVYLCPLLPTWHERCLCRTEFEQMEWILLV